MTKVTSLYSSAKIMIIAESKYFFGTKLLWIYFAHEYTRQRIMNYAEKILTILN